MRLIIDQQLPPLLAGWFREQGVDAVHVRDLGLSTAADTVIWAEAMRDDAVIISRDEDFLAHVHAGGGRLVWIRIGNCDNPTLLSVMEAHWPNLFRQLEQGERLIELRA